MIKYLEALRDPIWQSVGVLVAVVLGLVSIWIGYLAVRKKLLTYEINSASELATIKDDLNGRVSVLFDGKPVINTQLVILTLTNNGTLSISSNDFETPITVSFGKEIQLLTYSTEKERPVGLKPVLKETNNEIVIQPLLLNVGDHFSIKALVAGGIAKPVVTARIQGVREISEHHLSNVQFGKFMLGYSSIWFAVSGIIYATMTLFSKSVELSIFQAIWLTAGLFAVCSLAIIIFPNRLDGWLSSNGRYSTRTLR